MFSVLPQVVWFHYFAILRENLFTVTQFLDSLSKIKLCRLFVKIGEGEDAVKRADQQQDWYHEIGSLLEYGEPSVIEVLCNSLSDIQEGVLCLFDLILNHARDNVV